MASPMAKDSASSTSGDSLGSDGASLSYLATRIANPKKTGYAARDIAAKIRYDAFVDMVDGCVKHPDRVMQFYSH